MGAVSGQIAGLDICKILGVDPKKVKSINIRYAADELVKAEIVFVPDQETHEKIVKTMAAFKWEEIE